MSGVPQFATHYYLPGRAPFLNLSDLEPDRVREVIAELDSYALDGRSERRFGPRYMSLRRETEARLRQRFVDRGGRPVRRSPHYLVLGECAWFKGLYRPCAEVRVALRDLPPDATSITWPDSIVSMGLLGTYGLPTHHKPQYGQVFVLTELDEVVERYGLPAGAAPLSYDGHQRQEFDHFIEVQVWSDEPLLSAMS